jgi:hypothetical protein
MFYSNNNYNVYNYDADNYEGVFPAFCIGYKDFSDYSWSEIQAICKDGLANEYFSVGDTKTINIDALPNASNSTSAQTATLAIGDISEDGTTMTMLVTNYSKAAPTHEMNSTDTNKGGWGSTSMRDWLNDEYLSALSNDLQNVITIHSSSYSWSYEDDEVSYCKDKIWLLSEKEVFGGYNPSYENRGTFVSETQLAYFKNIINGTTMYSKNSSVWWWLRSSVADNNDEFSMVDSDGEASSGYADENASVFPAFYIG